MADLVNVLDDSVLGRVTKKVPFIEGAEVTFLGDVPGNFYEQLETKTKETSDTEAGYWLTVKTIVDWNFSGKDGKKLEVNVENFKKLPLKLQRWLFKQSTEASLTDDEKKKELPASS